jgi:MerR family redox-sensitive transcriptional activator SoxR
LKLTSSQGLKMTIGELATASGLPASTIRYWEKIGVLPKPIRAGGQRRYSVADVQRLVVLRLAQARGFRLDEMRHLLHGYGSGVAPPRRWQELARRKQDELDEQIARLKAMRRLVDRVLQCRCVDLVDCARIAASVMKTTK